MLSPRDIQRIVDDTIYKNFQFQYSRHHQEGHVITLNAKVPDREYWLNPGGVTPLIKVVSTQYAWEYHEEDQVVQHLYRLARDFECHEAGENFYYKGDRRFDPH